MVEITEDMMNYMEELSEKTQVDINLIKKEYNNLYETFKDEPELSDQKDLDGHIKLVLRVKYASRTPTSSHSIIPVGIDQIKLSKKSKELYSSLYVIDSTKKLKKVSFNGDDCDMLKEIQLYYLYKDVPLILAESSGRLIADDRADFSNMTDKKLDPESVIKLSGAKSVTLKDILESDERRLKQNILSTSDEKGYTIDTDWRVIHGMIERISTSNNDDGTNNGYMSLMDSSIDINKDIFDKDGNVRKKNIRCWVSPLVANYPVYTDVWAIGTLGQNSKTGEVTMTCYCVIPKIISSGA